LFHFCTTEVNWRANGIGIYGGRNNRFEDILVKDVFTYHGIMIDSETFQCSAAAEKLTIQRITLLRTSGLFWGAVWPAIGGYKNKEQEVTITDVVINDTWYGVFRFEGPFHAVFTDFSINDFCQYTGSDPDGYYLFVH
jgi:hypothetical protein